MEQKLREYVENIFKNTPDTLKAVELKEEIIQNLIEKYHDLLSDGKTEQAAYNISIASIGDVNELLRGLNPQENSSDDKKSFDKGKENHSLRSAVMISVAVMLYILSVVPCILFPDNEALAPSLMFIIIAIATGLIVFNANLKKRYKKSDDTIVENFKEWNQKEQSRKSLKRAINTIIWSLTLIAYFVISFTTGAWYISWVIFIMGITACGISNAIFELLR